VRAVVTAGGRIDGEYARLAETTVKALALVRGVSMLDRILDALRGAGATRIAVVGGAEVRAACGERVERVVDEAATGEQNVALALHAWDDEEPLLYATSDLPYVTAASVADFVRRVPLGAIGMPLAEHADFTSRFAGAPTAGIVLAGERVVNGGVFVLPPGSRSHVARLAAAFFSARKAPWRMASLIGPIPLLRLALRRLSVAGIEREALRVVGVPCVAVPRCAPELAFDADTDAEYRYACENA
jgi:GTP:adenosylcobinamide-phosphate guanylyltransferase